MEMQSLTEYMKMCNRKDNLSQWLGLPATRKEIARIAEMLACGPEEIVRREPGRYGGTWVHPALLAYYAQYFDLPAPDWLETRLDTLPAEFVHACEAAGVRAATVMLDQWAVAQNAPLKNPRWRPLVVEAAKQLMKDYPGTTPRDALIRTRRLLDFAALLP